MQNKKEITVLPVYKYLCLINKSANGKKDGKIKCCSLLFYKENVEMYKKKKGKNKELELFLHYASPDQYSHTRADFSHAKFW